jgi:hypothetical protein
MAKKTKKWAKQHLRKNKEEKIARGKNGKSSAF